MGFIGDIIGGIGDVFSPDSAPKHAGAARLADGWEVVSEDEEEGRVVLRYSSPESARSDNPGHA